MHPRILVALLLLLAAPALAATAPAAEPAPVASCPARTFRFESPKGWQVEAIPGLPAGREACSLTLMLDETNVAGLMRVDALAEPLVPPAGDDPATALFERFRSALVALGAIEVEREPKWRNEELDLETASAVDRASMRVYAARRIDPSIPLDLVFVTLHATGSFYNVTVISPTPEDQPEVWDANQSALRQVLNSFVATPKG